MWPVWERERLLVWADELQARGDPLGERIAISAAASQLEPGPERERLRARAHELEPQTRDRRADRLVAKLPAFEAHWEHGVLVELRPRSPYGIPALRERYRNALLELLARPIAGFMQALTLPRPWCLHPYPELLLPPIVELLGGMRHPPRTVRIGYGRWHRIPHADPEPAQLLRSLERPTSALTQALGDYRPSPALARLLAPATGMTAVFLDGVALPIHRLDGTPPAGRRSRLEAALARAPGSRRTFVLATRGLWDRALRVREVALEWLAGADKAAAAASIPDLLRLDDRNDPRWSARLDGLLREFAEDPAIVAALAPRLQPDVDAHVDWLCSSPCPEAKLAIPSLERQLAEVPTPHLQAALEQLGRL